MRIAVVTFRFGRDFLGGGERYLYQLASGLVRRGHEVEVFTTRTRNFFHTPYGYLIWDNHYPPGTEEDGGMAVHRFTVFSPRPGRGRRLSRKWVRMQESERKSRAFARSLAGLMSGSREHCLLWGWDASVVPGKERVAHVAGEAVLVVGGEELTGIELEAKMLGDAYLTVEVPGAGAGHFELQGGLRRTCGLELAPSRSMVVNLKVWVSSRSNRQGGPLEVSRIAVTDAGSVRELDLGLTWDRFMEEGSEFVLGGCLWECVDRRSMRSSRWHRYLLGPRCPGIRKAIRARAADFDLVMGSMFPMTTIEMAQRAAAACGKPFIAVPLFHPRDPNHYSRHLKEVLSRADGVEANTPFMADMMRRWGFKAFSVGPGFDTDEFASENVDGARFRSRFGVGDRPLLLWVGRKNVHKGYPEAVRAVEEVRRRGLDAVLVMIGPEEDYVPVSGEGVLYLGSQPREVLLDAYDACDVFILPSLHESFCMVFCEAWLLGKPVLGNIYNSAARGQIVDGVNGYLCRGVEEFAERAYELLAHPRKAREMGARGREAVLAERGWETIVERFEAQLRKVVRSGGGEAG